MPLTTECLSSARVLSGTCPRDVIYAAGKSRIVSGNQVRFFEALAAGAILSVLYLLPSILSAMLCAVRAVRHLPGVKMPLVKGRSYICSP